MSDPPAGFTVDTAPASNAGALPAGFTIDQGAAPSYLDTMKSAATSLPGNIAEAGKSALGTINDTLNPFSQANVAAMEARAKNPSLALSDWTRVGSGLAAVPELAAAPITGLTKSAAPLIAQPMARGIQEVGEPIAKSLNPNAVLPTTQQVQEQITPSVEQAMSLAMPGKAKPAGAVAPTIEELKAAAKAGYESPQVADVLIRGEAGPRLSQEIQGNLNKSGVDENLAPKTFGILRKLEAVPEAAEGAPEPFLTVDNLRSLRRTLGNAAQSIDPTERMAAKSAMQHVDEFLSDLPSDDLIAGDPKAASKIIGEANANYAAMKRASELDQRMVRSQLRAAAANSGMNVANTIRQRMADILVNPKLQRGFSADELDQMKTLVEGTPVTNAMRTAGNILGGGGGLMAGMYGLGALATHGAVALAPIAGYTLKKISNMLALRGVNSINEAVRMRSPLGMERTAEALAGRGPAALPAAATAAIPFAEASGPLAMPQFQLPSMVNAEPQQQGVPRPPGQQHNGGGVKEQQGFAQGGAADSRHKGSVKRPFRPEAIGARRAKDGKYYVRDPMRPGKYLMVTSRARPAAIH